MTENLLQSLPSTPLQLELTTHSYDSNDENMETDSSSSPSQYSNAVLPPFVSDDFYFNDVKRYYKSSRTKQLSLSYLMTVGAKALVLVEAIESSIQSAPNTSTTMEDDAGCVGGDSMFTLTLRPSSRSSGSKQFDALKNGMVDEAVVGDSMVRDERVKVFLSRLRGSAFRIGFNKRGRNSLERRVDALYEVNGSKGTIKLVWTDSIFGRKKTFHIENLKNIQILKEARPQGGSIVRREVTHTGISVRELQIIFAEAVSANVAAPPSPPSWGKTAVARDTSCSHCPFIRLVSRARSLDMQLDSFDETFSLLHIALGALEDADRAHGGS